MEEEGSRNHVDMHPFEGSGESRASSDITTRSRPIRFVTLSFTTGWWQPIVRRNSRSSDIQTFRIIRGPYPLHSLDFVEAIHALICCCQLLMTGSLHKTQSYAQRSSSLTYLKLLAMWITNSFCSSFKNAESEGQFWAGSKIFLKAGDKGLFFLELVSSQTGLCATRKYHKEVCRASPL